MKVIGTVEELQKEIRKLQLEPVGFVPTMGALHDGHLSLVAAATDQCPVVVVSIYVNPTQFNDKNDLRNYPRMIDADLNLLRKVLRNSDLVFTPDDKEIYPSEDNRKFHFGNLDLVMEALHRPGHFSGVAQVVSRLFDIVKITGCPIIREKDGLAMSSRNTLLEPDIRKNAPVIFRTISTASSMIAEYDIAEIKSYVKETINRIPGFDVEYYDIADDTELIPVTVKSEMKPGRRYFGCIAVKAGRIRLIDNVEIELV
jgi:pantoate--beta-alanine ligase